MTLYSFFNFVLLICADCVLCVLTFGTVSYVLFFYIVSFVCVHAAFYGVINYNYIVGAKSGEGNLPGV